MTTFISEGYSIVDGVLSPQQCEAAARRIRLDDPGAGGSRRLLEQDWCRDMAHELRSHPDLEALLGAASVAVQCNYFEKSADRNWLVPLHQDLSIPVASRVDDPALKGWSCKEKVWFVRAPLEVLEQMVAVRVHLDPCSESDGPLRVVPGSHNHGIIDDAGATTLRTREGEFACLAARGAALVMRPLLLHASSKGNGEGRRRVLHFVFGPRSLPHQLAWHTVV